MSENLASLCDFYDSTWDVIHAAHKGCQVLSAAGRGQLLCGKGKGGVSRGPDPRPQHWPSGSPHLRPSCCERGLVARRHRWEEEVEPSTALSLCPGSRTVRTKGGMCGAQLKGHSALWLMSRPTAHPSPAVYAFPFTNGVFYVVRWLAWWDKVNSEIGLYYYVPRNANSGILRIQIKLGLPWKRVKASGTHGGQCHLVEHKVAPRDPIQQVETLLQLPHSLCALSHGGWAGTVNGGHCILMTLIG